jgi:predicted amidohydrolase YtcJ
MTRWAAYANFEEKEKGTIEKNKYADFVMLNENILTAKASHLRNIKVLQTFVNGEAVYQRK